MIKKLDNSSGALPVLSERLKRGPTVGKGAEICSATSIVDLWNQLWLRSGDTMPLARHEILGHYGDAFSPEDLRFLATSKGRDTRRPSAALALESGRRWRVFKQFSTPNNPWLQAGGFLTDKAIVTTRSFRNIAAQIKRLPASFVQLDWIRDTIETQRLMDELRLAGCHVVRETQFETGLVHLNRDWDQYFSGRSKSFRQKTRRSLKKLEKKGPVKLKRHNQFRDEPHFHTVIDAALQIEHGGWKGESGSSLNANPEARLAYINVLRDLAESKMLEVQFLEVGDRKVAFEIGFVSHKTYYSHKIGFDPEFAQYSPGQLLMFLQLQEWSQSGEVEVVDTVGELNEASAKWCNDSVTQYRYTVGTRFHSRLLLRAVHKLKPLIKKWLGKS